MHFFTPILDYENQQNRIELVTRPDLEQNEAALSICLTRFASMPDANYCVVGVAKNYRLAPRSSEGGFLYTYRLHRSTTNQGMSTLALELVHKTPVDEIPLAMCAFQGKILIGVGKLLRLYDLGKKKLLRKSENKHIPNMVVNIQTFGDRIVVSDVQESVHFVKYRPAENQLVIFADDTQPRWVTTTCMMDYQVWSLAHCLCKFKRVSVSANTS